MNDQPMTHEVARNLAAAYVLGALEPAEEAAVSEHLLSCPEPHDEFAELGGVVLYLAESVEQVEPPPGLRDRIMAAAAADLAVRVGSTQVPAIGAAAAEPVAAAATANGPVVGLGPTIPFPPAAERAEPAERAERTSGLGTNRLDWAARIAAVVAIVLLGGWNLLLQGQLSDVRGQLSEARAYDLAIAAVIDAAVNPGSQTVVLAPAKNSRASGIATVGPDGSVVMAMHDLPATAGTQVYEAWVIVGKKDPIPVGGFTVGRSGTAAFTTQPVATPAGSTIAVTLEPAPGSTKPLGKLVAAGVSTAQAS